MSDVSAILTKLSQKAGLLRETAAEVDQGLQELGAHLSELGQRLQALSGTQAALTQQPGPTGKRRGRPPKSSYETAPVVSSETAPSDSGYDSTGTTGGNDKVTE
jgi:hypothetical protein